MMRILPVHEVTCMSTKEDEGQHCTHDRTGERAVQCYPRLPYYGHAITWPAPRYRLLYVYTYVGG